MDNSPPPPRATRSSTTTRSQALKPRANVQRKAKADTDKFLLEEAERSKSRVGKATRTSAAKRGRGGLRADASGGHGAGEKNGADASARDTRIRGGDDTTSVFGAGLGLKPKAKRKGDSSLEGKSEWVGGDPELKNEEANPDAATSEKEADKGKGKEKKSATSRGKERAAEGGVVTDDFGAQGSADAHVALQVVPSVSEDDEPDEERRDIEKIWLSSDEDEALDQVDEDDDMEEEDIIDRKAKRRVSTQRPRPPGGGGLRPVRAPRTILPPEEEIDFSSRARKHNRTTAPRSKVSTSASAPDFIDIDEMDRDNEVEFIKEVPSSPDLKKKHTKKAAGKGKDVKFSTETVEERAERLRGVEDVRRLRQIFTPMREADITYRTAKSKGKAREGEEEQGRLFLMQFPPLMPFLIDPNAPPSAADDDVQEVKAEGPSSTQQPSTIAKTPAPPPTTPPGGTGTGTATAIKKDPDAPPPPFHPKSSAHNTTTSPEGILTASGPHRLPSGYVGKLNVHASGKITLDWGGCDMEVRMGTEVGFLQDAVVLDDRPVESQDGRERGNEDDEEYDNEEEGDGEGGHEQDKENTPEKENQPGTVYALGQIQGKLVVVPDWARLYD